ncbi:hypothetical protein DMP07_03955 [Slackia faecicanis]|uniref:Uncharacterized protein n=1 Tax=Slackia faecicanis TaxID=255723 RepID=A0A3N0AG09_9ACTN|nr:hypothetical protein [Slackia faecicanis]RNL20742.1 hypothetical protein DMP07_03955 [Slackia faecicanis]
MKRLTSRAQDGTASVEPERMNEALDRLAAYEDMHDDLVARLADLEETIAERKAAGTLNASTGNQLIAQKVALKTTIGMFDIYGIE